MTDAIRATIMPGVDFLFSAVREGGESERRKYLGRGKLRLILEFIWKTSQKIKNEQINTFDMKQQCFGLT